MKPEQCTQELEPATATAEDARRCAVRHITDQHPTQQGCDPTDTFEAILDAYARDPERWDGLE
jgi:hypothetical protein